MHIYFQTLQQSVELQQKLLHLNVPRELKNRILDFSQSLVQALPEIMARPSIVEKKYFYYFAQDSLQEMGPLLWGLEDEELTRLRERLEQKMDELLKEIA